MSLTAPSTGAIAQEMDPAERPGRTARVLAFAALVASAAIAGLGLVWLLVPGINPFGNGEMLSLVSALLGATAMAGSALGLGAAGVILAAIVVTRRSTDHAGLRGVGAGALALALGILLGSMGIIAFAGYLFGLAAVAAGIITIAVMLVRAPRVGLLLLAGLLALLAIAIWLAGLTVDGVTEFAAEFGAALAAEVPNLAVVAVIVGATLIWASIAVMAVRSGPSGRRFESWLVRHRRSLTILAALGPIPYGVARVSWLTPWPLFAPTGPELSPAILTTGLMLGAGAAAASILTLGLILPWGRTFPSWMPRIGGRAVPVYAAVVPGSIAAAILCISAPPMVVTMIGNADAPVDGLLVNLVLPLWYWGPLLALAVWAYAAWRGTLRQA